MILSQFVRQAPFSVLFLDSTYPIIEKGKSQLSVRSHKLIIGLAAISKTLLNIVQWPLKLRLFQWEPWIAQCSEQFREFLKVSIIKLQFEALKCIFVMGLSKGVIFWAGRVELFSAIISKLISISAYLSRLIFIPP